MTKLITLEVSKKSKTHGLQGRKKAVTSMGWLWLRHEIKAVEVE
jgi:hypothetical protein